MYSARFLAPVLASAAALSLACSTPHDQQGPDMVLRGNACRSCKVVAETIAFLGHPDDTVALGQEQLPAVDSRGRFYLADKADGTVIAFGPDGRVFTRFGKRGSGPGEFQRISTVVAGPGDTLWVLAGGSIHVISPSYEHVGQFADPHRDIVSFEFTALRDGRLLREGGAQHSFKITSSGGEAAGEVRLQDVDTLFKCGECGSRIFRESSAGGTVWSGSFNRYVMEEHSLDGRLLRRITREAEWFAPWGDKPRGNDDLAEYSVFRLMGALQTADGTLWTHTTGMSNVDSLRKVLAASGGMPTDETQIFQLMVTHVEGIDPDAGKLLGRVTLRGLVFPLGRDYAGQLAIDASGDWAWQIVKFSVEK
jgi:hypothetical protein